MVKRIVRLAAVGLGTGLCAVVLYAAASYPSGVKSFTTKTDGAGQTIFAAHINEIQDEIVAIEGALLNGFAHGLKPSGDAVSDLGTSGLHWRDLFVSRNATFGGSVTATGGVFGGVQQVVSLTGTNNDLALTAGVSVLRLTNATLLTLTGFVAGTDGQRLIVRSEGAGQVDFAHQNAGSAAGARLINFATSGNTSLAAGLGVAEFVYDGTNARWRLVQHEQGAWLTPTFAAGSYTANGIMTWTLAAGDVSLQRYYLHGRQLTVSFFIITSTVGGTVNTQLLIGNGAWGGFTANTSFMGTLWLSDNAAAGVSGRVFSNATTLIIDKVGQTNWTLATDQTSVLGSITFEVT